MNKAFKAAFFSGNRQRLRASVDGLIVVTANGLLQKSADETYVFTQDKSFWYLTGIDEPDAVLVMPTKAAAYIILPPRDKHKDQWDGVLDADSLAKNSGIGEILAAKAGWQRLRAELQTAEQVHTLLPLPPYHRFYGFYSNPTRARLVARLKRTNPKLKIAPLREAIKNLRIIKQPVEIEALTEAIRITEKAFRAVADSRSSLSHEYEAEAVLHAAIRRQNSRVGYDSIVASGVNSATIHYRNNNAMLNPKDMLLIDAGASVGHYAADITRMFRPKDGLTDRQNAVISAVERVKAFAHETLKPGVGFRDYEQTVAERMGEELIGLGLIKKATRQAIKHYFPSLTSHHLGLDVHDIANYDEVIKPNMVLTVEPGIYVPEWGIGVRLEDDVLITTGGNKILSDQLPHLL